MLRLVVVFDTLLNSDLSLRSGFLSALIALVGWSTGSLVYLAVRTRLVDINEPLRPLPKRADG